MFKFQEKFWSTTFRLATVTAMILVATVSGQHIFADDNSGLPKNDSSSLQIKGRKVIDLTHVLGPGLPNFHLGENDFTYKKLFTVAKDGYAGGGFSTVEHYGTHVDAPSHFFDGKRSIDQIPAEELILPCVVIDVRDEVKRNADYLLTVEKIKSSEEHGAIPAHTAVLLLTGWEDRWDKPSEYRNPDANGTMHFPGFGADASEFLVNQRHVAALGIDTLSIDAGISDLYGSHKTALGAGLFMMENLKDLHLLPARGATLICAPLRIKDGTGSPARVMAIVP